MLDASTASHVEAAKMIDEIINRVRGMRCEFVKLDDDFMRTIKCPELACDSKGYVLAPGDWYVVVTCSNGYKYYVNVTYDSVLTMCAEVFNFLQYK